MKKIEPIRRARTRLLLDYPWYGALSLRLRIEPDETLPYIAATDGVSLLYNPTLFDALPPACQLGVIAHEVEHCARGHMSRRRDRDPQMWNVAADFNINRDLIANGFVLPEGALIAPQAFDGMYTEQIYSALKAMPPPPPDKPGDGKGGGCDFGHVSDAPKPGSGKTPGNAPAAGDDQLQDVGADWQVAVEQASMLAKKAGQLPASAARTLANAKYSASDYRDVMRRFITTMGDYSWANPNRRYIAQGIYLPGAVKTRVGCVVFVVDTSGSIQGEMLTAICEEVKTICATSDAWPDKTHVVYCDARVQRADEFEAGELEFKPAGGGGTKFQPAFDWIASEDITPDVCFYLTDLESSDRPSEPDYPVIWITPEHIRHEGEKLFGFGETARFLEESR